jgi:hypothetical protein
MRMNDRSFDLPLESYRLAQYTLQLPCYICEGPNLYDAELCRHCFAPMALAHQAASQKVQPRMLALLGSSGVGKTVYLGMLMDMLSRPGQALHVMARGAFSITLQQITTAALSRCEFPDKTPNEPDRWNWIHCLAKFPHQRKLTELIVPDMAGEAILQEVDHPQSYPAIRSLTRKCGGLLLLVDAVKLRGGSKDQEHFALKVLTFLGELDTNAKTGWGGRPIAIVFSKADQCEACFDDPAQFARRHAPALWQCVQERFRQVRFYASGVAGACAYRNTLGDRRRRIPLRIEPRGIVEPFGWLLENIAAPKRPR